MTTVKVLQKSVIPVTLLALLFTSASASANTFTSFSALFGGSSSAAASLVKPALASLPSEFGSEGVGAGQLARPAAVAVSQATGDVYVLDSGNNRVDEFTGDGVFVRAFGWEVNASEPKDELQECTTVTGCQAGAAGAGAGQLDQPEIIGGIAVDSCTNSLTEEPCSTLEDPSVGDVYVLNGSGGLEQFDSEGHFLREWPVSGDSVAVDPTGTVPTGTVYVGENGAVQEYDPETGTATGPPITLQGAGAINDLAINAQSEIYVTEGHNLEQNGETHPARHYNTLGVPVNIAGGVEGLFDVEPEGSARSVALNAAGEVYISQRLTESLHESQLRAFSPAGVRRAAFAVSGFNRLGVAFGDQTGALYVSLVGRGTVEVLVVPSPGPLVSGETAGGVEPTAVVAHAVINPETPPADAADETHYLVEYGVCTSTSTCAGTTYEHTAPASPGVLPGSFNEEPVDLPLSGLSPQSKYHYRFVATNQCEKVPGSTVFVTCENPGEDATFETLPPARVEEQWATDVRATSATLHAKIDPLGSASTFHFAYGPCGQGECATPEAQAGSGRTGVPVEQHVQGLVAGEEYHYRVIVTNALESTPGEIRGEQDVFTTQTGGEAGGAGGLPDHRQWELVSPPDKHGALLEGTAEAVFVQAAADGKAVVYSTVAPSESQPHGFGEVNAQVLSTRATLPGGTQSSSSGPWESRDLSVAHAAQVLLPVGDAYRLFSTDLTEALLQPTGFAPALSGEATEQTPYLRDNSTGAFTPLVVGCKPNGECPADRDDTTEKPFVPFGEEEGRVCTHGDSTCGPRFEGATPDLSHVVIGGGANARIEPLLKGSSRGELYEWSAAQPAGEQLQLVSVLPSGQRAGSGARLGEPSGRVPVFTHAISADGSRVFWHDGGSFMRDMTRQETIELQSGFEGANAEGSLVFYGQPESSVFVPARECKVVESVPLLPDGEHLECQPVNEQGTNQPIEDGMLLATSEDGSIVYFERGADIYVRDGDGAAQLVAANVGHIREPSVETEGITPPNDPWRASPNGEWFAFMSDSPLTGYDNHDAVTGVPDEELYLYHAAGNGGGGRGGNASLTCASCDPTGERPHGINVGETTGGANYAEVMLNQSVAATIPGWAPYENAHAVYDPRVISNEGRLFFNATDGLVPKDVNGQFDVYEFEELNSEPEAPPNDSCTTSTRTGTALFEPAKTFEVEGRRGETGAGCVALISSGESEEESIFQDASETGEDVFFTSSSRLSTADLDGTQSMWDAQTCTTSTPCPPAPATEPTPCTTEASCKQTPEPEPGIYQPPASATFNGPGNQGPEPKPAVKLTAAQLRAQKLAAALKSCKKRFPHSKKKRASCEKTAKKHYGPLKSKKHKK
jgi:NHL repeat